MRWIMLLAVAITLACSTLGCDKTIHEARVPTQIMPR